MRDRFVLLGPGDRKKGGEEGDTHHPDPEPQHEHPETEQFQPAVPIKVPEDHEETLNEVRNQYHLDPFFQTVLDSPKQYRNFSVADGIVRIRLNDRTLVCIPDVKIDGRRLQESIISQAHALLAHLGAQKTLTYLRDRVWWK
ncbi:hypothetical protein P692DRAFT_201731432, partial [Suillus brevipes Sb2]